MGLCNKSEKKKKIQNYLEQFVDCPHSYNYTKSSFKNFVDLSVTIFSIDLMNYRNTITENQNICAPIQWLDILARYSKG